MTWTRAAPWQGLTPTPLSNSRCLCATLSWTAASLRKARAEQRPSTGRARTRTARRWCISPVKTSHARPWCPVHINLVHAPSWRTLGISAERLLRTMLLQRVQAAVVSHMGAASKQIITLQHNTLRVSSRISPRRPIRDRRAAAMPMEANHSRPPKPSRQIQPPKVNQWSRPWSEYTFEL